MKVLVATEKPFAKVAVDGIRKVVEGAGYELALLEKYTDKQQLLDAVADADALIIRSDIVDEAVLDAAKQLMNTMSFRRRILICFCPLMPVTPRRCLRKSWQFLLLRLCGSMRLIKLRASIRVWQGCWGQTTKSLP